MNEHLTLETLARLVDETPSEEERSHLEGCARCADELEAMRDQSEALTRLPDIRPETGDWEVLQARLVSEGLLEGGGRLRSGLAHTPGWMKVAAATVLFVTGTGFGAAIDGGPLDSRSPVVASNVPLTTVSSEVTTVAEAAERVRRAERIHIDALVDYRRMVENSDDPRAEDFTPDLEARLAALEFITQAGRTALREAPADPILNGILAGVMAERNAAMRLVSSDDPGTWY